MAESIVKITRELITEFAKDQREEWELLMNPEYEPKYQKHRVLYACQGKNVRREVLSYDYKEEQ